MSKKIVPATSSTQSRRIKVTLACVTCRRKKVKCDGLQPCCTRCKSSGVACQYSNPPKKRGPPKSCIEVIENRAHRVKSLLGRSESIYAEGSPGSVAVPSPAGPICSFPQSPPLVAQGQSCSSEQLHFQSLRTNKLLSLISDTVEMTPHRSDSQGSQFALDPCSPVDSAGNELCVVEAFFEYFNLFFPVLSRPHYMHQLCYSPSEMDPLLRYAVFAVGCAYISGSDRDARASRAYCYFHLGAMSHDASLTLSTIQALIILCWDACLSGERRHCWDLRRRLQQAIGKEAFHRDPDASLGTVRMEMHRRAYWVAYVMEQWLTMSTGRSLWSSESTHDCRRPRLEDCQLLALDAKMAGWRPPQPVNDTLMAEHALQVTAFTEMIRLVDIFSGQDTLNRSDRLTQWLLDLPSYLGLGHTTVQNVPSPMARIYHILYFTVQAQLFRDEVAEATGSTNLCASIASTILHLADQMIQEHQEKYLVNTFPMSLTLAVTIQAENVPVNSLLAKMTLDKGTRILQKSHSTCLNESVLDMLVQHLSSYHDAAVAGCNDLPLSDSVYLKDQSIPSLGEEDYDMGEHPYQPTELADQGHDSVSDIERILNDPIDFDVLVHDGLLQDSTWIDPKTMFGFVDSIETFGNVSPVSLSASCDSASLSSSSSYFYSPEQSPTPSVHSDIPKNSLATFQNNLFSVSLTNADDVINNKYSMNFT